MLPLLVIADLDSWSPINIGKNVRIISVRHRNNLTDLFWATYPSPSTSYAYKLAYNGGVGCTWGHNKKEISFTDEADVWMIRSSDGYPVFSYTEKEWIGEKLSIAAGRQDLVMAVTPNREAYLIAGITASNPGGTGWHYPAVSGANVSKVACGRDICFGVKNGRMYTTGIVPKNPTNVSWVAQVGSGVQMISANGEKTVWKLDESGFAWKAVHILDKNAQKINWERRGFDGTTFQDIAVSEKMAFVLPSRSQSPTLDNSIRVRTGCPIFDFEDNDVSSWTSTECKPEIYSRSDHCSMGHQGKWHFSCPNAGYETAVSPTFQIRHSMLHFLIGGGSCSRNYIALVVDNTVVRRACGHGSYKNSADGKCVALSRWWWDVEEYINKCAHIKVVDHYRYAWGFTSFDDLRASPPCFNRSTFTVSIKLRGFYVSKLRQLSVNASFPVINGNPVAIFVDKKIVSGPCKSEPKRATTFETSPTTHDFTMKFKELLEDVTLQIIVLINDHDYFARPTSQTNITLGIVVNFADEYVKSWKQQIQVHRRGNEIAELSHSTWQSLNTVHVGSLFQVGLTFAHMFPTSHHRAYDVLVNVYTTSAFTLDHITGLKSSDVAITTSSPYAVKIPILMLRHYRVLEFYLKIGNVMTDSLDDVLMDVIYCIRPNCRNIYNNDTDIKYLIKSYIFKANFTKNQTAAVKSMSGFTTIFDSSQMLIFICGQYKQRTKRDRRNCYYSYISSSPWTGLRSMVSNITAYDPTGRILYGMNEKGVNMKIYGDTFESILFLSNNQAEDIFKDKSRFSMPKYMNGSLDDFNPLMKPNITFVGSDGYTFAINSFGGSVKASSSSQWDPKNKWMCCPP
eukprot:gene8912-9864_t